jgi:hypothetical protein
MNQCPWPLVAVLWKDAFDGPNGWTDIKEYEAKAAMVCTVGWLWPECLVGYVTVVNSYFPDEAEDMVTVGMPVHIPVGMVRKTIVLQQPGFEENELT